MAQQVKLTATPRIPEGSPAARRLRAQGRVPATVYGRAVDGAVSVSVDGTELLQALHTAAGMNVLIDLEVDGQNHLTLPRDLQRHVVRGDILHVDFYAISEDQMIEVEVPVHLVNDAQVSRETGGVVEHLLRTVAMRVRPLDVPTHLDLDVAGMEIGDVRRVQDLDLPADAELVSEPDRAIVTVSAPQVLEEEVEEEEVVPILETLTEEELAELTEEERAELIAAAEEAEEAAEEGEEPLEEGEDEEPDEG